MTENKNGLGIKNEMPNIALQNNASNTSDQLKKNMRMYR